MADILQMTFSNSLLFDSNFIKFVPKGPFNKMPALVQTMVWWRQASICTNTGWVYRCIYKPLDLDELTHIQAKTKWTLSCRRHFQMYSLNREYHPYNTRYRNDLHTASYNLDVRKFSIRAAGPVLWNALPREIRDLPTVHSFKRRLKLHLSENQRNPYWTFGDNHFSINEPCPLVECFRYKLVINN